MRPAFFCTLLRAFFGPESNQKSIRVLIGIQENIEHKEFRFWPQRVNTLNPEFLSALETVQKRKPSRCLSCNEAVGLVVAERQDAPDKCFFIILHGSQPHRGGTAQCFRGVA